MALVKCPDCGNEVSTKAQECPKCGYPIAQTEVYPERTYKTSVISSTVKSQKRNKRPILLTVLCVLEFIFASIGLLIAFSGIMPAPKLIIARSIIRYVAALGMWNMKKWGPIIYIGVFITSFIEFNMFRNYPNASTAFFVDLFYPGFVFIVGLCYLARMK